jgi:ABC-type molybdate transport system substrate-binding protein
MRTGALLLAVLCIASMTDRARADTVRVLGAGSLREVLTEIGDEGPEPAPGSSRATVRFS